MSILSGLSTSGDTASFYTSIGWRLMQTAPFLVVDAFTRFLAPVA